MKKNRFMTIAVMLLVLCCMVSMSACAAKADEAEKEAELEAELAEQLENGPEVVKTIEGIDEDLGPRLPLQISSIILYDDGSVELVPVDDLKKNEIKDEETASLYPFEESGKVKDVWVVDYGNGGYRTVVALLDDGTISAVNGSALVEDHIIAVMDNVAGRDNFVSVENESDESATYIIGVTEDGDRVVLDYSLNL